MFESLKKAVTAAKEGALEAAAKAYINQKIQNFGTVSDLDIDSRARSIRIEVALKGEAAPVTVTVPDYEVSSSSGAAYVIPKKFEASREWISAVLNEYIAGQRWPIPAALKSLL